MNHILFSIVVMGVCGTGKSTIGEKLADKLAFRFIDGDDLHPKANIQKMAQGFALDDLDRKPWLENIQSLIHHNQKNNNSTVVVCSALKKSYRDILRKNNRIMFIFLDGDSALISQRMQQRENHFMKPKMLETQLLTLERPEESVERDVQKISINQSIEKIVEEAANFYLRYTLSHQSAIK